MGARQLAFTVCSPCPRPPCALSRPLLWGPSRLQVRGADRECAETKRLRLVSRKASTPGSSPTISGQAWETLQGQTPVARTPELSHGTAPLTVCPRARGPLRASASPQPGAHASSLLERQVHSSHVSAPSVLSGPRGQLTSVPSALSPPDRKPGLHVGLDLRGMRGTLQGARGL